MYPPGIEFIEGLMACFYAGVVAVPTYPPDPKRIERTLPRLEAVVRDSGASVALTIEGIAALFREHVAHDGALQDVGWLATDAVALDSELPWEPPKADSESAALLQYTSGSTGSPKGVVLTHRNLLENSAAIERSFGHGQNSQGVIWLPPYHDMGLIGGIIQPLFVGFPVTLLSPIDFLRRPARWLEAVTRYGATTSGGPNFAYDLCQRIGDGERAGLDLSTWDLAFCGAEPIRAQSLRDFCDSFSDRGFRSTALYPCYGLAESTLIVTGGI